MKYREVDTGIEKWWIIEDEPKPDISRQELGPEHTLAVEMTGKQVGDSFFVRRDPIQDRTGTILEIWNKYDFRKMDSIDRWEERFPEHSFVRKFTLGKTEDGESDLSVIRLAVDMQADHTEEVHKIYKREMLSILGFALLSQVSVPESLQHLAGQPDLPIRCCLGNTEEFEEASAILQAGSRIILDPSAAATLYLTGFFRHLPADVLSVITSPGVLHEYRQLRESLMDSADGFVIRVGGRHVFVERKPEEVEKAREKLSEYITWMESFLALKDGSPLASWQIEQREQAVYLFGRDAAECLAIAQRNQVSLWTDDLALAVYARHEYNVRRVWTQDVGIFLNAKDRLSEEQLEELVIQLVKGGYFFTRVSPSAILRAAKKSAWLPEEPPFSNMLDWLKNEDLRPEGSLGIAINAVFLLWQEAPLFEQKQSATAGVFRAIGADW